MSQDFTREELSLIQSGLTLLERELEAIMAHSSEVNRVDIVVAAHKERQETSRLLGWVSKLMREQEPQRSSDG